jgi:hypothetical protein
MSCGLPTATAILPEGRRMSIAAGPMRMLASLMSVTETRLANLDALLTRFAEESVPVVALTTNPFAEQHAFAAMGIACVLLKPCLPEKVAAAIRTVLGHLSETG